MHPQSNNHPFGTHSLVYYTFIVSSIIDLGFSVIDPNYSCICMCPYKLLPSKHFYPCIIFSLFHFHRPLLCACGSSREPWKTSSLFVHSFICPITHSFLNGFQPNLYISTSPMYALLVILFLA